MLRPSLSGRVVGVAPRSCWPVALALTGLLSSGCEDPQQTFFLSESDNGRSLAVEVGDRIEVTLGSLGGAYYGSPVVSSGSVRLISQSEEVPNPAPPGGVKTQRYVFEAAAVGRAEVTIRLELPRPNRPEFRFAVTVY